MVVKWQMDFSKWLARCVPLVLLDHDNQRDEMMQLKGKF